MANLSAQAQAELADLALALAHNPATRAKFAGLVKEAGQPYRFNDVEAAAGVAETARNVVKETLEEQNRAADVAATQRRMNVQRASLVRSDDNPDGLFDEKAIKERLEPFMQERGLSDYNDGAVLFQHSNPDVMPRAEVNSKGVWDMPTGDWLSDPKGTARKHAYAAVGDIIAKRQTRR